MAHYLVLCYLEELQWNWPWIFKFKILFTSVLPYRCYRQLKWTSMSGPSDTHVGSSAMYITKNSKKDSYCLNLLSPISFRNGLTICLLLLCIFHFVIIK